MNAARIVRRVIAPTLAVVCAAVGVAFAVDNLAPAAWADAPAIATDAPTAPEDTATVAPVAPELAETAAPIAPAPTAESGAEIGEPIYCDYACAVAATPTVEEDEPGWDCRTMGNGLCGVTVHGTVYVLDFATYTFSER